MAPNPSWGHTGDDQPTIEVPFSTSVDPGAGISGPYPLRGAGRVLGAAIAAMTAPTVDQVLTLYLDSAPVGTVTLPAGEQFAHGTVSSNAGYRGHFVQIAFTSGGGAGMGATTVTVDVL